MGFESGHNLIGDPFEKARQVLRAVYRLLVAEPAVHLAVSVDLPDPLRPPHLPGSETQSFCVGRLDPSACDARGLVGSGCLYKQFYGRNHHQEQDCLRFCGTLQELDHGLPIFFFDRPLLLQIVQSPQADPGHLG